MKGNRFGTFGGVFTPSILTILGVIMYMRLPWIVGNAGLDVAIGIIVVAHIISITTGLSVSSISTDKSVRVGGPYYMISRSLGLPLGGTLGLALAVGLAFSISLYIIGFSESFLAYFDVEVSKPNIRLCGTVALLVLAGITLWSTALAIKMQYFILAAIVLSLISIIAGPSFMTQFQGQSDPGALTPNPVSGIEVPSIAVLFGIFFPAVTGFTAGVNMSGDLRDPKRAIPRGTLLAILVGLLTYLGLTVFLAKTVPADALAHNPSVLLDISLSGELVVAGIWGATLSSALGSILGAPRILQALSLDRITPRILARGHGHTNEPRTALLLALCIAEGGILIAELDAIARIVSMFFIATYGFLNLSCAIEMWASPDFRPEFKVPRIVPVLGLGTCMLIMYELDTLAMLASVAILTGLFAWLKRRELTLETGDTWEGVWSSVVRTGLHRLKQSDPHHRNWRPNVLLFRREETGSHTALLELGHAISASQGVLTDFQLSSEKTSEVAPTSTKHGPAPIGQFHQRVYTRKPYETMGNICQFHGFSGVEPNTLLMRWEELANAPNEFASLLKRVDHKDFNVLLLAYDERRRFGVRKQLDVWCGAHDGSLPLALSIIRFVTASDDWHRAQVRFLILNERKTRNEVVYKSTRQILTEARVDGTVKVLNHSGGAYPPLELVRAESAHADLTITRLPRNLNGSASRSVEEARALLEPLGSVLFVRSANSVARTASVPSTSEDLIGREPAEARSDVIELPPLTLPENEAAARETKRFSDAHSELVVDLHSRFIAPNYEQTRNLLNRFTRVARRHFEQILKHVGTDASARQHKLIGRSQSTFLFQSLRTLSEFGNQDIPDQQAAMEQAVESLVVQCAVIKNPAPTNLVVPHSAAAFDDALEDSTSLRAFKRWRRLQSRFGNKAFQVQIELSPQYDDFLETRTLLLLHQSFESFAVHSHQVLVAFGKLITSVRAGLRPISQLKPEAVQAEYERVISRMEELAATHDTQSRLNYETLIHASRNLSQALSNDLGSIDPFHRAHRQRTARRNTPDQRASLGQFPALWAQNQQLTLRRAELGVQIASILHRLTTVVQRLKTSLSLKIQTGILREYEKLRANLGQFHEALSAGEAPELRITHNFTGLFDEQLAFESIVKEIHSATSALPEHINTLTDEGIDQLHNGHFDEIKEVDLSLRRLIQFLIEAELVGHLHRELTNIPVKEHHAIEVAQDALRLISFNLSDFDASNEQSDALLAQLRPVLDSSLTRIDAELEQLQVLPTRLLERFDTQLAVITRRLEAYALTGSPTVLKEYEAGADGPRVLAGVERGRQRVTSAIRDGLATLLYRQSAGVLLARKLGWTPTARESIVDRVLAAVSEHVPKQSVLESLPFYYRQLFLGKTPIHDTYWVGRESQLQQARRAVDNYHKGYGGALFVTGERDAGKSSFCEYVTQSFFDPERIWSITAPPGGSTDPSEFKRSLEKAVGMQGDYDSLFQTLPEGSVLLLPTLESWWERSPDGLAVIELMLDLIDRYGDRCFFVAHVNSHAFRLMDRLASISDQALQVIECGPMNAETLRDVIMLRHRSTGLTFQVDGRTDEELSMLRFARLFAGHFDYADGLVGTALQAWIAHIDDVQGNTLSIRKPSGKQLDVLEHLRMDWIALLVELILHTRLSFEQLMRITRVPAPNIRRNLTTLCRMGLVVENGQGAFELDRYVHHLVVAHLTERGVLR